MEVLSSSYNECYEQEELIMAWDPNEKGSWAWFTKEASEQGGVESYINNIYSNGYLDGDENGHRRGVADGVGILLVGSLATYGVYKLAGVISKWRKERREVIIQKSEESKAVLKEMYEKTEDSFENNEDTNDF